MPDDAMSPPTPIPGPTTAICARQNTALIVIDMQTDFCGKGGYVDPMGYDLVAHARADRADQARAGSDARAAAIHVLHTREGHRPDLADLPANKRWRSRRIGAGIGDPGPCGRILVRGEPGWEIIPELAPLPGEPIIDKPGKGSFCATDLELILRLRGIAQHRPHRHHHRRLRPHDDARGQRPRLRVPAAGGLLRRHRPGNHQAALKMITMQGGVFGAVVEFRRDLAGGRVIAMKHISAHAACRRRCSKRSA